MTSTDTNTVAPWELEEPNYSRVLEKGMVRDLQRSSSRHYDQLCAMRSKMERLCQRMGIDYEDL